MFRFAQHDSDIFGFAFIVGVADRVVGISNRIGDVAKAASNASSLALLITNN